MTVSEQIIQVLDALGEKFGLAIDWTSENIIPYVETLMGKLVSYEIWTSVAWMVIMVGLSIAAMIATKVCYPTFKRGWEANSKSFCDCGWQAAGVFAIAGLVALYLATIIVVGTQIMDIIKCTTFPEMYIFEYIQGVINAGS